MLNIIIIYSLLSFLILILFAKVSYKLNLVDIPSDRKKHSKATAYTGGLAISVIYVISIVLFEVVGSKLNIIMSISFIMAIVGFVDDKYQINIGGKLSLQIIPIMYLIVLENFHLIQIGDYNYFKLELNSFSIPFTLFSVLFLINSFNYFDGKDGTLGFTTISTLVILYFLISDENIKLILITILLPLCIFLCFNFSLFNLPKLFLGDGGSLLLGFIVSFILIYLANKNLVHPILLAWSVVIFVFEFISINLIRIKKNKAIFKATQDHLHHIFLEKTESIFLTNFFISSINIVLFIAGYFSFILIGPLASLILFIFSFIVFFLLRDAYSK
tara:strand:- start:434 stop:1423 length:990 start_codon:yes stop_codon:yes gene_type:complete